MRRKDREITSREDIEPVLQACKTCRLAMTADGAPYVWNMVEIDGGLKGKCYFYKEAKNG